MPTNYHVAARYRGRKLNALLHWKRQTSLVTHLAAKFAGLKGEETKKIKVNTIIHGEVNSTCAC